MSIMPQDPDSKTSHPREPATHVVDRHGNVWFLCPEYDGGMATRATATGPISAGIAWLGREAGPLLPFDRIAYRRAYPRADW